MPKSNKELHLRLADHFLREVVGPTRVPQLIRFFGGDEKLTVHDVFEDAEASELIYDVLAGFTDEQAKEFFRPYLHSAICSAIGAKHVQIEW